MATKLTSPGISSKPVPEQPTAQKPEKELSEEPEEQPIVMAKAPEDTAEPDKPDRQPAPQANLDTLTEQRAQLKPDTGTDSDAHSQPAPVVQAENWTADESPAAPRMARLGASEANTAPAGGLDKVKSDSASAPASAQLAPAGNDGKSVSGYAGKSAPETAAPSALSEGAAPPAAAPPRSPGASIQLRNQPDSNRATPAQMLADLRDCIKSGDKSTAESLADKLHTMGNLTQQQWQHLGEIEQQLGRPKKAIQAYQQAAKGPDTAISNKAKSKIAELSN